MFLTSCGAANERQASEISNLRSKTANNEEPSARTETININAAGFDELQRIPHVGTAMAEKIIEYRDENGPFKRPEELMLIPGMSDVRYRRIRHLIRVE